LYAKYVYIAKGDIKEILGEVRAPQKKRRSGRGVFAVRW
jgi:hypothetical protein